MREWEFEKTIDGRPRCGRLPGKRTREIVHKLSEAKPGEVVRIELKTNEQDVRGYRQFYDRARSAVKILQKKASITRGAIVDGRCYAHVTILEH